MNTGAIEAFEAAMHTRTNTLEWLEEDLRRARQWNDWTGQGADAATTGISRLGDAVTDIAASAQAAKHTADRLYNGVAALWEHVKNADALSTSHAFVIGDDGGLIDLRAGVATVVGADEAAARADARRDLEQAVHDILLNGRELEATAVGELTSVASGSIDDGEATTVVAAGARQSRVPIPPPRADPAAVAAWWSTLADPELAARGELSDLQKELIRDHPEAVGPLVGVPVVARDQANKLRLLPRHPRGRRLRRPLRIPRPRPRRLGDGGAVHRGRHDPRHRPRPTGVPRELPGRPPAQCVSQGRLHVAVQHGGGRRRDPGSGGAQVTTTLRTLGSATAALLVCTAAACTTEGTGMGLDDAPATRHTPAVERALDTAVAEVRDRITELRPGIAWEEASPSGTSPATPRTGPAGPGTSPPFTSLAGSPPRPRSGRSGRARWMRFSGATDSARRRTWPSRGRVRRGAAARRRPTTSSTATPRVTW